MKYMFYLFAKNVCFCKVVSNAPTVGGTFTKIDAKRTFTKQLIFSDRKQPYNYPDNSCEGILKRF